MGDNTCKECRGHGVTPGRHWLGLAIAELLHAGSVSLDQRESHRYWFSKTLRDEDGRYPTSDLGDLTTALAGQEPFWCIGYDTHGNYNAVDKIIIAAGFDPKTWGICPECKGGG